MRSYLISVICLYALDNPYLAHTAGGGANGMTGRWWVGVVCGSAVWPVLMSL